MSTAAPLSIAAFAIDTPDPRALAEFYGRLLGWEIDEAEAEPDWVELADPAGGPPLAFQLDPHFVPPTWPDRTRPQMMHVDVRVATLEEGHERAVGAGARLLPQPPDRQGVNWRVYADPDGHPFCVCAQQ
ncbi:VOC family protein [Saccharopolyspora gloriosae]|uniref:Catechol 2,3-dioxygenase-like lactoylglutathione lyase family enzyme n=1 Tax=Saccharopolyspora gloriosae TaxID=455344 RepID=A0A840NUD8_9PSEU|nr:VOC family protein [Saccharopolyspora gloriosae]MBB5072889.1 catechol 2,3-dioxygenase-like lactoylglutathione lyase family enzyme [Saccharopolyspora gloriosae]